MNKLLSKKGFTLVELLVVIVIIGILAVLAIPKFTNATIKAKCSEAPLVCKSWENAAVAYITETGSCGVTSDLVFDGSTGSKWWSYGDNGSTAVTGPMRYMGLSQGLPTAYNAKTVTDDVTRALVITRAKDPAFATMLPAWN